jgi:hypothetical protein
MKRNMIIKISLIVILLLGLIIYILSGIFLKKNNTIQEELNDCLNPYNPYCITNLAVKYDNISICKSITSYMTEDGCFYEVYVKEGNISNCDKVRWGQQDCRNAILNKTK